MSHPIDQYGGRILKTSRRTAILGVSGLCAGLLLSRYRPFSNPLDDVIERFRETYGLAGAVVAFGATGESPEVRAYGHADQARTRAMTPNDMFKIASLSKPVTAAAVLALVREGRLTLNTTLADIFPHVARATDPRLPHITLRQLLQHSGGWDNTQSFDPFFLDSAALQDRLGLKPDAATDCAAVADAMLPLPLQFDPGTRYAYSNIGYCWLGRVLGKVGADSYAAIAHRLLPETNGLSLDHAAVTVEHPTSENFRSFLVNTPSIIAAAGGWISTAGDYFLFASQPSDTATMERPPYAVGQQHYGLGWRVWSLQEHPLLTHYGAMPGVFSVVLKRPQGQTFVALFNGRPAPELPAFHSLMQSVLSLPQWQDTTG